MRQRWILLQCASLVIGLLIGLTGCSGRDNQVVGDSNGWTLEEYKKAIAEEDAKASKPQE